MTTINNNIKKSVAPKSLFDDMLAFLLSSVSFNQGDLLCLDASSHAIRKVAADTDSSTFLGVAKETIVSGLPKSSYQGTAVDAAQAVSSVPGPEFGSEVELSLHVGDSLNPGDPVYLSTADDAQTVSASASASGSHVIGVYNGPAITGVAGTKILVMLGCRYPQDTLMF